MVAPGRTLSKSQKRELRAWLIQSGSDPDFVLSNPLLARQSWSEFQASLIPAPALASEVESPTEFQPSPVPLAPPVSPAPTSLKRGRGLGRRPAGDMYSVRLPPDLLHEYRMLSLADDCSVSTLIRKALKAYLGGRSGLKT